MTAGDSDHRAWYDRIAERSGGYRKTWSSTLVGDSGEEAFVEVLWSLLRNDMHVLDAGCGSGEFTLEVAGRAGRVTGFDFSEKMIAAAERNAARARLGHVSFVHTGTGDLALAGSEFDLVYSRRGPTSILLHPEVVSRGGWMLGVHSGRLEVVKERLSASGLDKVEIEEFEALELFPTVADFAAFWSRMPGHPNYLESSNAEGLAKLIRQFESGGQLCVPQYRFVWKGQKRR